MAHPGSDLVWMWGLTVGATRPHVLVSRCWNSRFYSLDQLTLEF